MATPVTVPDLLAAEPAVLTGASVGYARVSTHGRLLDRQLLTLNEAGCSKVFADKQSGRDADRPERIACLAYLRPGDTLVVPSLDRLARSLQDLLNIVGDLRRNGVGFRSLHEAIDTTTPGGRLVFHIFAALAEFIRELIVEGTHEGLAAARARGTRLGQPPAMTPDQMRSARTLLAEPDHSVTSIAKLLGVSRSTIYKYLPELGGSPAALPATESAPVIQAAHTARGLPMPSPPEVVGLPDVRAPAHRRTRTPVAPRRPRRHLAAARSGPARRAGRALALRTLPTAPGPDRDVQPVRRNGDARRRTRGRGRGGPSAWHRRLVAREPRLDVQQRCLDLRRPQRPNTRPALTSPPAWQSDGNGLGTALPIAVRRGPVGRCGRRSRASAEVLLKGTRATHPASCSGTRRR
ncbi:DNA invertase Pin-like site-specific DNA recombinase [Kribbella orskensis]|uniref:DNA invertase Pin-like site-specific DNA recombinase n=1 Tax=Kribbella orskensis TaxID=2512216 RepID=A0ABY2B6T7_9ACTN|nr:MULTISPECIES: recombinase family protein [Kribbella]TCN29253.1 DNA invertase Pin-like site-specific DNA recombinase [Kribbella sp. VKM Ac-2500]TCO09562.1 DNA invertase Pin-like site-specific DNA recombinase [Kribbella orskensis]